MRSLILILAILAGVLLNQAAALSFLIKWLLAAMLFFSFLKLKISVKEISAKHLIIAFGNVVFATLVFFSLKSFNLWVALASSIIALAPTAIAAPVMTSMLKGDVTWVALSTIVTNLLVSALIPFYIPYVYGINNYVNPMVLIQSLFIIFFIPFALAMYIQKYSKIFLEFFSRFKKATYSLFVTNIFLASAKSTHYIMYETQEDKEVIILIAGFTALMCILNFAIGFLLGGKKRKLESGLAFGQKNTMFSVWISLTYLNPLVSLAPMSYVLFQNAFLSFLMYKHSKK